MFTIRVEKCVDVDDTWVWSLVVDGGVFCDGYSGSEGEAYKDARARIKEELARLSEGE